LLCFRSTDDRTPPPLFGNEWKFSQDISRPDAIRIQDYLEFCICVFQVSKQLIRNLAVPQPHNVGDNFLAEPQRVSMVPWTIESHQISPEH
jgi:hypothetical protein